MAIGMGVAAAARRRARKGGYRPMSEINVTPMVDVMLVLLIIFMVTAPLLTTGVPVNLPQTSADTLTEQTEPLVVSVDAQGKVFLQDTEIDTGTLIARLQAITQNKQDTRIYVRGDKAIDYGRVMEVMGLVKGAGFSQVALIVEQPPEATRATQIGN
ncbi:MAG: protein TolR [Dongiaceae bacterium]